MTHLFPATPEKFKALKEGKITFDILRSTRQIKEGDKVIYQKTTTVEEKLLTDDEIELNVTYVFVDTGIEMKKDMVAFGFHFVPTQSMQA